MGVRSILDCAMCAAIAQKISESSFPREARAFEWTPGETHRGPDCGTIYLYKEDHDPGEPMVPATDTYVLIRLTPVLARGQLQGAPEDEKAAAQPLLDALARDWEAIHAAFADASAHPIASQHIVKHVVESLTDYYLEKDDKASFRRVLLESPQLAIRAHAGTDFVFIATEEHPVWMVRAFSPHLQRLAAAWLQDDDIRRAIFEALTICLESGEKTVGLITSYAFSDQRVNYVAYSGLSNALYRKLDPAPVIDRWKALAQGDHDAGRLAARLLKDVTGGG